MRDITVHTRLIGLLGTPLGQSFSPACHNAVYGEMGWDLVYLPVEVADARHLAAVVGGMRHMPFAGFAVTKPYKQEILRYLDSADALVEQMGACNTVAVEKDGRLTGYNTDGIGAIRSMEEEAGVHWQGATFTSFGAGGTARAVCLEIAARAPRRIHIVSRSAGCEELAAQINRLYPGRCTAVRAADEAGVFAAAAESDVLLNLSGLGMAGREDATPLPRAAFRAGQVCFDATYNPARTRFLAEAEAAGCRVLNGLGMLGYQGTRQIAIWTGHPEPVESMLRNLRALA